MRPPVRPNAEPGVGLPAANAEFPLLESYIDAVVEGGFEYGEDFARELIETTSDWSDDWLNDRELARRPWVRDPASSEVDELLMSSPEAGAKSEVTPVLRTLCDPLGRGQGSLELLG